MNKKKTSNPKDKFNKRHKWTFNRKETINGHQGFEKMTNLTTDQYNVN